MAIALDARIRPHWSDQKKLTQLKQYLFSQSELGVRYDASHTKPAINTYHSRSGNCLSIATLFVATARHVGLVANFRVVSLTPTWDHQGATMVRYEHIVAHGTFSNGHTYVVDFLPTASFDDDITQDISDRQALAHYYNNLGAEHIVRNDHDNAILSLQQALGVDPNFADAWNNIGTAYKNTGVDDFAAYSYHRALHVDPRHYSTISNLALFYRKSGLPDAANHFEKRAERYRKKNPYIHYFRAQTAIRNGQTEKARQHLQRAIKRKPYEPAFHALLREIQPSQERPVVSDKLMTANRSKGVTKAPISTTIEPPVRRERRWQRHIQLEALPGMAIPVCDNRRCS